MTTTHTKKVIKRWFTRNCPAQPVGKGEGEAWGRDGRGWQW